MPGAMVIVVGWPAIKARLARSSIVLLVLGKSTHLAASRRDASFQAKGALGSFVGGSLGYGLRGARCALL